MRVLAIIPAYNEEECLSSTVSELRSQCPEIDYLVVNDGSRDKTASIIREEGLHGVNLPVNTGLTSAFRTGMKYAYRHGYDAAIQFDADGQHVPTFVRTSGMRMYGRSMIKLFATGFDVAPEPDTVAWAIRKGNKVVEIPAQMRERQGGESYLKLSNVIKYMSRTCLSILLFQWLR